MPLAKRCMLGFPSEKEEELEFSEMEGREGLFLACGGWGGDLAGFQPPVASKAIRLRFLMLEKETVYLVKSRFLHKWVLSRPHSLG